MMGYVVFEASPSNHCSKQKLQDNMAVFLPTPDASFKATKLDFVWVWFHFSKHLDYKLWRPEPLVNGSG